MLRKLLSVVGVMMLAAGWTAVPSNAQTSPEEIKKRGELVVGIRYDMPPYGYVTEGGGISGIDAVISEELARRLGVKLRTVQVTAQSRIPMLQNGSVDVLAAGIAKSEEREKVIDFSQTYFESGTLFLVKEDSTATSYRDLDGKTIATVQGTPYLPLLDKTGIKYEATTFQEYPQAMLAVLSGKADALVADDATLATILQQAKGLKIIGAIRDFPSWHIALGLQKDSPDLKAFLNATLADLWAKGLLQEAVEKQGLRYDPEFALSPMGAAN